MKKCKGCGITLQYDDPSALGYAKDESFDYCQRCFRLIHYGDIKGLKKSLKDNNELIKYYKEVKDALYVLVIDIFDALISNEDSLIDYFKDKDLLVIINKIDLLPKNITEDKINNLLIKVLDKYKDYPNIEFIITHKNDATFNSLFFEILEESNYKKVVFVGRANAGKSTIINKLLKNEDLTTSIYPGTTIAFNEIKFNDYIFIDTPGLLDEESILTYIDNSKIKKILPLKTIKTQNFQFYERQSYFVEGLLRVDINPKGNGSVIFFINNNVEVHRTKLDNGDNYLNKHEKDFELKLLPFKSNKHNINTYKTFVVKGLGLFKIKGRATVNVYINDKIKVYVNEVDI